MRLTQRPITFVTVGIFMYAFYPSPTSGLASICSNGQQDTIRRTAHFTLGWSKAQILGSSLKRSSVKSFGMSYSWVVSRRSGPFDLLILKLSSPKDTFVIEITEQRNNPVAKISLKQTCVGSVLEPWPPYWRRFLKNMRTSGYPVKE